MTEAQFLRKFRTVAKYFWVIRGGHIRTVATAPMAVRQQSCPLQYLSANDSVIAAASQLGVGHHLRWDIMNAADYGLGLTGPAMKIRKAMLHAMRQARRGKR